MTDIDLITELRPEVQLPAPEELGAARSRLTAAITAAVAAGCADAATPERSGAGAAPGARGSGRARRPRSFWPVRRLALAGAAAAVAAGIAAALLAVPGHSTQLAVTHHGAGPVTRGVTLTAVQVLDDAAAAALQRAAVAPRPDQFVYTETEAPDGTKSGTWLSVDGSRNGLQSFGQGDYVLPPCTIAQAEASGCYPDAGYFPDMPAQADQLLAYLDEVQIATDAAPHGEGPAWLANNLGKAVSYLMQTTYLLPGQQAALYELMAQTPGFTVVQGLRDAIGRTGVGVEWKYEGSLAAIILDPRTYAFLGVRTWPPASYHGPGASLYDGDALIKIAIVGTLPPYVAPPSPCAGRHPAAKCRLIPRAQASAQAAPSPSAGP